MNDWGISCDFSTLPVPATALPRARVAIAILFRYSGVVKRKRTPAPEAASAEVPAVPPALMEQARRAIQSDRVAHAAKCIVCGDECAPNSTEELCWVCRRLKLSAWRDSDSQMPAQE